MTDIAKEFPDYPVASLPEIPAGFVASHWHNDACPSWERGYLKLFIDYPDAPERDDDRVGARFSLQTISKLGDADEILQTDDWQEIVDNIACHNVGQRVRFTYEFSQFPHFMVDEGATGTVIDAHEAFVSVKCDAPIPGCEEWQNVVHVDGNRQGAIAPIKEG